jgi:hypothetical protein
VENGDEQKKKQKGKTALVRSIFRFFKKSAA